MFEVWIDGKIKNRGHSFASLEEATEFLQGYFSDDLSRESFPNILEIGKQYEIWDWTKSTPYCVEIKKSI